DLLVFLGTQAMPPPRPQEGGHAHAVELNGNGAATLRAATALAPKESLGLIHATPTAPAPGAPLAGGEVPRAREGDGVRRSMPPAQVHAPHRADHGPSSPGAANGTAAEPHPAAPDPDYARRVALPDRQQLTSRLLAIVSERTGYPEEMLALDADLEADL